MQSDASLVHIYIPIKKTIQNIHIDRDVDVYLWFWRGALSGVGKHDASCKDRVRVSCP